MTSPDPSAERPNILLLVVDCLRHDRCPVSGPTDLVCWKQLRDRGTCFEQTISAASYTAVCFASLLTGQYSFVHGVNTMEGPALDPRTPSLADYLQQHGYHTSAYVTGPLIEPYGLKRGFDFYQYREIKEYVYGPWGDFLREEIINNHQTEPWFTLAHFFEVHAPRQFNGLADPVDRISRYDLAWGQMDKWLGDLIQQVPKNTLIILTGDHGESIVTRSDRTLFSKMVKRLRRRLKLPKRPDDWKEHGHFVYEELNRIPWVICGPGIPAGKVIEQQVSQIDMTPTLLDWVGKTDHPPLLGRSLKPLLEGKSLPEQSVYLESGSGDPLRHWHALRKPPWKYVEHPRHGSNLENCPILYNFVDDPEERHNVIRSHPEIALELRSELDRLIHHHAASGPEAAGQNMTAEDTEELQDKLKSLGYI